MNFYLIFSKVSVIFLLIIVGFILSKKKILSSEGQKELTSLLLYVLLPCTLIKSFDIEYSSDILARGLKMSVFMFAIYIVSYLIATLVSKKYAEPENRRDIHVLSMILPNVGFMGYPIVNALIGPEAIIYAVMCNVGFEFFAWTFGIRTVSRNSPVKTSGNPVLSLLSTPAIMAILAGMVLFTTPLYIPEPLISTVNLLAAAMSPVAMMIVGISLANSDLSRIIKNRYIYISSSVRLVLIPLITMFALKALSAADMSYYIPMIVISMPTAGYATMFATKYENDSLLASEMISMSTLMSLISIPVILSLL